MTLYNGSVVYGLSGFAHCPPFHADAAEFPFHHEATVLSASQALEFSCVANGPEAMGTHSAELARNHRDVEDHYH
jgi:hypothetical protein